MKCSNCETTETPMWRRCVDANANQFFMLCNACGLYFKSKGKNRPKVLITKKSQLDKYEHIMNCLGVDNQTDDMSHVVQVQDDAYLSKVNLISCTNCQCINTSLWRKDADGNNLCNACGLYLKKNRCQRPVKQGSKDIMLEIDQKLIRVNQIRRRRRSHTRVGVTKPLSEKSPSETVLSPVSSHSSSPSSPSSAGPSDANLSYKLATEPRQGYAYATAPNNLGLYHYTSTIPPTPISPTSANSMLLKSDLHPRLPPISHLFNQVDQRYDVQRV